MRRLLGILLLSLTILAVGAFAAYRALSEGSASAGVTADARRVPVEVAPIEAGTIRDVRWLSGSLEARARFTVAAKVGGLIESIAVDIGDEIARGQVVAEIDDAEFVQAVAQAQAELAVRKAEQAQAESQRDLAQRDYARAKSLSEGGMAPASQLDATAAAVESATAALELAKARVLQAEASLELARIRLGYADVKASWVGGPDVATVARREQDAGNTVQPGDPVVSIAALDPLMAVVSVTEVDYERLHVGQKATLTTEGRPGETFAAEVVRIAPVFEASSRQARVELRVDNPERLLRPGMFIRVRVVLREEHAETIVPAMAIVRRGDDEVVFTVDEDVRTAREHAVGTGIVQDERVQITSPQLRGRVVVLGQHLLEDGSPVDIVEDDAPLPGSRE